MACCSRFRNAINTARRSRNQTEPPSTQRRRGRREPQSFLFNHGWTRMDTDKGEMRISRINRIQLAIILAIRVKHCAPLFPIRVNPCPSVVKNLLRKERCHEIAPQTQLSFEFDYNNEDKQNPKKNGNNQPQFFPVFSLPGTFFQPALHRLIGWLISSNHVSAICGLDVCRKNRLWIL